MGRVWASGLGLGWALAGWTKIEGLGKVKFGGLDFLRDPNGKPPPGIERYVPGDAKNIVFG